MVGGGAYDSGARHQRTAIALGLPLLSRAAEAVPIPNDGTPFVFVDYGSATGFNTFVPAREVIAAVRRRAGANIPVCVVHDDQPDNDFGALFRTVATSSESYARLEGVFPLAVGRSFFEPVVPAAFASIGWSANAAHWISAAPHPVPGSLAFRRPRDGVDTAFARQAHEDWTRFLGERAKELRQGGQIVVVMVEADEEGVCGADHFVDLLYAALAEKVRSGAIRAEEVARMVLPIYFRTEREIRAPFASGDIAAALSLVEHEHAVLHDPLWAAFEASGDPSAFARAHVTWQRGYTENVVESALDTDRRPDERRAIIEALYDDVRARVEARPADARCSWRLALLRMIRRSP
jgi:hypothetical protein